MLGMLHESGVLDGRRRCMRERVCVRWGEAQLVVFGRRVVTQELQKAPLSLLWHPELTLIRPFPRRALILGPPSGAWSRPAVAGPSALSPRGSDGHPDLRRADVVLQALRGLLGAFGGLNFQLETPFLETGLLDGELLLLE